MKKIEKCRPEQEIKHWKRASQTLRRQTGFIGIVAVDKELTTRKVEKLAGAVVDNLYGNSDLFISSMAALFRERRLRKIADGTMKALGGSIEEVLKERNEHQRLILTQKHSLLDAPHIDHLASFIEQNEREHSRKVEKEGGLPECMQVFVVPDTQVKNYGLSLYPGDEGQLHMLEKVGSGDFIHTAWVNQQIILSTVEQAIRIRAGLLSPIRREDY